MLAISLLVVSCSKKDGLTTTVQPEGLAPVRVCVNDFSISVDTIPSKDGPIGDYSGVKAITLAMCWNLPVRHPLPTPVTMCARPSQLQMTSPSRIVMLLT